MCLRQCVRGREIAAVVDAQLIGAVDRRRPFEAHARMQQRDEGLVGRARNIDQPRIDVWHLGEEPAAEGQQVLLAANYEWSESTDLLDVPVARQLIALEQPVPLAAELFPPLMV